MKAPRWNGKACEVGPLARMFVRGLFQDGVALAATPILSTYYLEYTKTVGANSGLDPRMVAADIAVALLKGGLATIQNATVATALSLPTTTNFTYAMIVANLAALEGLLGTTGANATITAAYGNADTVITGIITTWIVGIVAGASTMDRLRARALESLYLIQEILGIYNKVTNSWAGGWAGVLKTETGTPALDVVGSTWRPRAVPANTVAGWGGTEAPRGALMHMATITGGKITKYQCIVPTTWNGSPAVGATVGGVGVPGTIANRGAIEAAMIGVPYDNLGAPFTNQAGGTTVAENGVEVLRVAQSFDPCIACAVH